MCLTNLGLRDKKPLSQKLIVRNSRFREFGTAKWCVITDVFRTVLFQQHHLPRMDEIANSAAKELSHLLGKIDIKTN